MISFNQDIATALDRAIVKITDKFLEPPIMITISKGLRKNTQSLFIFISDPPERPRVGKHSM